MKPLLSVENLKMHFPVKGGVFLRSVASCKAVDGVSLTVHEGETLGLVGEGGQNEATRGADRAEASRSPAIKPIGRCHSPCSVAVDASTHDQVG